MTVVDVRSSQPYGIEFTPRALAVLALLRRDYPTVVLLLEDAACCSVSNVFVRSTPPPWAASLVAEQSGIAVYAHPSLERSLPAAHIIIDAVDSLDDSLSLETDYGKRFLSSLAVS